MNGLRNDTLREDPTAIYANRWLPLAATEGLDLSPSLNWPTPTIEKPTDHEKGPVMVSVEYHIDPNREEDFRQIMHSLRASRLRDGAIGWQVYGDPTVPRRYLEEFMVGSWLNHLRQHDRVTASDAALQEGVRTLLANGGAPVVTHFMVKTTRP